MDGTGIALIIIGSLVLLAGIGFLLFKLVFEKNRLRRQIRELDSRFQYLHALLIGQDANYLRRLEVIARSNLLYVDIHTRYLKRFKEVRDKYDAHTQSVINNLKDLADDKKFKILKEALKDANDVVATYESEVNGLNNSLLQIVKPEEDCRQAAISLREKLRSIKQDYYSKQADLQIMAQSFEETFNYIDDQFAEFESLVESAQYDDAKDILPKISNVLLELSNSMGELPNLCATVVNYIPDKIASLENAYDVMQHENYPCHHLCVTSSINEMKNQVTQLTGKIKQFNIRGVEEELNNIASRIDDILSAFDEEKKAKETFEADNENTYKTVNTIERRFIKLCNTIPQVSKIFIINEEHQQKINIIQNDINKLGATKRTLDTLIHSSTKQPFSALVKKMTELSDASKVVIESMDEFSKYLMSLKEDSETAHKLIYELYENAKKAEYDVTNMKVAKISEKYAPTFDRFYELVNLLEETLQHTPIDVDKVNECVEELNQINSEVLDKGSISEDYNMMLLAENAIVYANRDRHRTNDIDALITQAESLFNNGEFEQSYIAAGEVLNKIHQNSENEKR